MEIRPPSAPNLSSLLANTRRGYMVEKLDHLNGPTSGFISLPLWLDWSAFRPRYHLTDPQWLVAMYDFVLRTARSEDDLVELLDRDLLCEVWPSLDLPAFLKDAWERQHPALRDTLAPDGQQATGCDSQ